MSVRLHVWGKHACFTRAELKAERVSYDVMTPSAARGILEAIHWKPAIRWHVDRIHVLTPIRFRSLRRNEVGAKASAGVARAAMAEGHTNDVGLSVEANRQQRASTILVDVAYVIEAHFTMTHKAGPADTAAKHVSMFNRRAEQGQCFHRPYFGTREFSAHFQLLKDGQPLPASSFPRKPSRIDLGWMLHDIDFANGVTSRYFRAEIVDGIMAIPPFDSAEVKG
jgi:CRISPR-associated protein Cas5d